MNSTTAAPDDDNARRRKLRDLLLNASKQRKSRSEAFLEELTCELVDVFGGPRGLALETFNEFKSAQEGGIVRKDLLKAMYGLMEKHQRSGNSKDVSDLTDEELINEALPAVADVLDDDDLTDLIGDS